jgi:hypothetical protein
MFDVAAYVDEGSVVAAYHGSAYERGDGAYHDLEDAYYRAENAVERHAMERHSYLANGGMDRTYGLDALRRAIRRRDALQRAYMDA